VTLYISVRFEFKMAVAAIVAVLHDILVTVGIYSLTGFQVTPDTVVAVLTVLGYSLYDTVVVFDRIRENAKGLGASGRITYSEMVNLSMNQTLARSINTSLVAIVPVLSVLVVGSFILGATSLQDFGLALVIGLTSGAYSSIFIASPLLAMMKEREPRYTTIRQRLEARGERGAVLTPASAAAMAGAAGGSGRAQGRAAKQSTGVIRPGAGASSRRGAGTRNGGGSAATEPVGAAAGSSRGGSQASTGGGRTASGPTRPGGNRPPPRPRKGKGKGGKGKRR
jgi:preprotein translocase subunit SecF